MASDLMREYARAAAKFSKAETDLAAALDKLAAARDAGDPAAITPAYKRAQQIELDCSKAFDSLEHARRAVWQERARLAEAELEQAALPLLSMINYCHRAGGAVINNPVGQMLSRLSCMTLPAIAGELPADMPPIVAADSSVLERAEESNIVLLRGRVAL